MRGFYVERCYLSNFTGSFVYFGAAYGHIGNSNACNMDNLNFQKAFDTVPSNGLLKPKTAGILEGTLGKRRNWLENKTKHLE